MKLFPRQTIGTESDRSQQPGGQRLQRFKLVGVFGIAALLGSLLASVAALAVLHPTAAQAQTNFTPSVTITVPADSNLADIEFTVSFADGDGGTDGNGADCSTGIDDLTYTSTATGTTTTSDSLPSLVNLPASGTAGANECVYDIDITLKNPGTGDSADRLKIVRPGAKPATVSAADSAATDTWAAFPDFSSYMLLDCGATNWLIYSYAVFPFVDDGSGSNVFAADDAFGNNSPILVNLTSLSSVGSTMNFLVPDTGTWLGANGGCRFPNQENWNVNYSWPEEFVAASNPDLKLVRSPAFSDVATGTLTQSAPSTLMVYETTYVHTSGGGGGGGTARTTFMPSMTFENVPAKFAGDTLEFSYSVASGSPFTMDGPNDDTCSQETTEIYRVQSDGSVASDARVELIDSPTGTDLRCSYTINYPYASNTRLLAWHSSPGEFTTGLSTDPGGGGNSGDKFIYQESTTFDTDVDISVPDATFVGVGFTVVFLRTSGGGTRGVEKCSAETTVMYEVASGSTTAVPADSQMEATLINVPGSETSSCVYSVAITLTDSSESRLMRDPSASALGNVQASAATVTDTWVAAVATSPVSKFRPQITIPDVPNGHAGETFTFTYSSVGTGQEVFPTAGPDDDTCSEDSTEVFTVGADDSAGAGSGMASVTSGGAPELVGMPEGESTLICSYDIGRPSASNTRYLGLANSGDQVVTPRSTTSMFTYGVSSTFTPTVTIGVPMGASFEDIGFTVEFSFVSGSVEAKCSEDKTVLYESNSSGGVVLATTNPAQTAARLVDEAAGEMGEDRCVYDVTITLTESAEMRVMRDPSASALGNVQASAATVTDTWVAPDPAPAPGGGGGGTPMPDPDPAPMPGPDPMPDPAPAPDPSSPTFMPDLTIEVPAGSNFANIVFTVSFADGSGGTDGSGAGCSTGIADLTYTSADDGTTSTSDSIPLLVNLPTGGTAGMHECEYVAGVAPDSANASKIERAGAIPTFTAASPAATDIWAEPVDRSYTPPACSGDLYKPGFVVVFPFVDDGDGRNVFAGGESDFTPRFRVAFQNRANVFDPSRSIPVPNTSRVAKFSSANCLFANGAFDAVFPQRVEVASGDFMGAELTLSAGSTASKRISSGDRLHTVVYETTYKVPEGVGGGPAPTPLSTFMPLILFDDVPARYAGDTFTFSYEAGDGTDASIVMSDGSDTKCSATATETFTVRSDGSITSNGRQTLTDSPEGTALRCFYVVNRPEASSSRLLAVTNTGGQTTTGLSPNPGNNFAYGESRTFTPTVDIGVPRGSGFAGIGFTVAFSYVAGSGTVDDKCSEAKTVLYVSNSSGGVRLASSPRQTAATLVDVGANSRGFESSPCVYSVSVSLTDPDEIRVLRSGSAPGNVQASAGTVSDTWVATGVGVVSARPVAQPEPLIRPAGSVGELPVTVSLTVPSVAGRIFGSGDVFEVNVSVPGPCGLDTQLFGGVQASDGVAYGVPASQPGRSQLIGPGTRQVNNRAAYSLASYVESGGQRTPCELRVTQLTTPLGCAMRGASQDLLDRLYVSAVWSQGAVGYDISVSYDCQPELGWVTLEQGWMILPFNGEDGTLPGAFVSNLDDAIASVWVWNTGAQSWRGWAADGTVASLTRLNRGDLLMVYSPVSATVSFSPTTLLDIPGTGGSLTIPPLYSMQVFGGNASVPLFDLFGFEPGSVAVLFRWDAANQSWHYYLPGRAPLASVDIPWFTTINPKDVVFMYNIAGSRVTISWA